jgi:hypothetical protein
MCTRVRPRRSCRSNVGKGNQLPAATAGSERERFRHVWGFSPGRINGAEFRSSELPVFQAGLQGRSNSLYVHVAQFVKSVLGDLAFVNAQWNRKERLDRQLSLYNPASDISWINAHAARMPVVVEPCLFDLLDRCQRLSVVTEGAFDMTVGPLMQAWWSTQKEAAACGAVPDAVNLDAARQAVGFEHLRLVQHGAPSTSRDVAWRLISALPGRDTRSMRQSRSYETTVCRTR